MNKKFLTIFIIIVILLAIAVGVYFGLQNVSVILSPQPTQTGFPTAPIGDVSGGGSNIDSEYKAVPFSNVDTEDDFTQEQGVLSIVSDKQADYFWIYSENEEENIFFISQNSLVKHTQEDGVVVENLPRLNPYKVVVSKLGSFALVWFDSGIFLFDSEKEAWTSIPYSFSSASFSPDESSIVFSNRSEGIYTVSIFDVDDIDDVQVEAQFKFTDMNVVWIKNTSLLLYPSTSYNFYGTAWIFNTSTHRMTKLFSGKGLDVLTDNQNYLARFSSLNPLTIRIDVFDIDGSASPSTLSLSTISSKCVFDGDNSMICGVPYILSKDSGIQLPDSYMQRNLYTKDEIYMFNLQDSSSELIFGGKNISLDITSPVTRNGFFYFINRLDSKLYRLDISHE